MCNEHLAMLNPATRAALGPRPVELSSMRPWMLALTIARREIAIYEGHGDVIQNLDAHLRAFRAEA